MISLLTTWVKKTLKILAVFLLLYVFGDFRINDVNVKDYLQEQIPPHKLVAAKDWTVKMVVSAYKKFEGTFSSESYPQVERISKQESVQNVIKQINQQEEQKMLELLKQNISVEDDLTEQEKRNQDLRKTLDELVQEEL